ncbi:type II secretion system protein M [Sphingomonas koreensis]|nr:type II secretion system protein M [Sphingomonas koreensis]TPG43139.1 type II secretion system protein M [Sphingomonas koreensis]
MIAALKTWFDGRSLRERRMLLAMVAMLVVTIFWFGLIAPVTDGLSSSRTRLNDAVLRLADTEMRLDAVKALQQSHPAPIPGPLDDYLRQSASDAGFALSDVNAQGDGRVQIAIPTARPGALFSWIADLDGAGVIVATIDVSNNGDQTVSARMTLMKRGA